jgi:hypothetical protein
MMQVSVDPSDGNDKGATAYWLKLSRLTVIRAESSLKECTEK